ncbi:MAG: DUF523 and DUF1722 domain-containing protein [Vallitaleaceae bacterium]|jgi:uncharacterized protein YbgA (DUF1722 family)/uncharacterized protein YbbK (DUF523 family)|nr:DUF523 and DUF1722 domain-containing protein [Vallitaleaceae bacterium]
MFIKPNVIISKCLEHGHCRFDGSMISSQVVKDMMAYVNFIPICPEMAIGLSSPRDSLRLIDAHGEHFLIGNKTAVDYTVEMKAYVKEIADAYQGETPDGFLLKSRSPSCGVKDVKSYKVLGKAPCINKSSKGIFGGGMMEAFGDLILEDEARMMNFDIREHFYIGIFTKAEFRELSKEKTKKGLVAFHSRHKYLFMACSQNQLKILGKIVANHEHLHLDAIFESYENALNQILKRKPTKGQYTNVLLHIFGYFSENMNSEEKAYFLDMLGQYRDSRIPLMSLLMLLKSWVFRFDMDYLKIQSIFEPYPKDLIHIRDSGKIVLG